ncbi:MAG: helix-turn-helix domain-containing protein [Candidatus Pacebacteria bacterium]|nr:helix-turn-helix domain-containing protein [Candidatus Paceibacterota bacterium]
MSLTKREKEYIQNIGKRIIQLREEKEIKQIELAIAVNIEDSALRRIETGRTNPTIKSLLRIADALDVELKELLEFEE